MCVCVCVCVYVYLCVIAFKFLMDWLTTMSGSCKKGAAK